MLTEVNLLAIKNGRETPLLPITKGLYISRKLNLWKQAIKDKVQNHFSGMADNLSQIYDYYNKQEILKNKNCFIVVTPILKANQPSNRGFRFSNGGKYIGSKNICAKYLYNQLDIDYIYKFDILEVNSNE